MSEPTKAQLREQLAEARAEEKRAKENLAAIDSEARAYHRCYAALSKLEGSFSMGSRSPDKEAIRRVLDTLKARFGIEDLDTHVENTFEMSGEAWNDEDEGDRVISMLIDALRQS